MVRVNEFSLQGFEEFHGWYKHQSIVGNMYGTGVFDGKNFHSRVGVSKSAFTNVCSKLCLIRRETADSLIGDEIGSKICPPVFWQSR